MIADPAHARAYLRWQRAAGPYWPYVCLTPLLEASLPRASRSFTPRARRAPLEQLERLDLEGSVLLLDLPPLAGIGLARWIAARGLFPVPIVQRWPARPAVLPCRTLAAALLGLAPLVRRPADGRGLALLLDGERAGRPDRPIAARAFDNRYALRLDRFPPAELLAERGLRRAFWLGPEARPAADLRAYAEALAAAGLPVEHLAAG